jgi:hypothetical protein
MTDDSEELDGKKKDGWHDSFCLVPTHAVMLAGSQ